MSFWKTAMGLADDIRSEVRAVFRSPWSRRDGNVVPEASDLKLSNDAVMLDAVVLYADMAASTAMVQSLDDAKAAELYKASLYAICKVIRSNSGEITAFDGDRVMAVYIGGSKNTSAAKTALQIQYTVNDIVVKEYNDFYPTQYSIGYRVGISSGKVLVARTGIRGSNDLVWVGDGANEAAKLCAIKQPPYTSFVTSSVFSSMLDEAKFSSPDRQPMWTTYWWAERAKNIYASNWKWTF